MKLIMKVLGTLLTGAILVRNAYAAPEDECDLLPTAESCFAESECAWLYDTGLSCGYCMNWVTELLGSPGTTFDDFVNFDCASDTTCDITEGSMEYNASLCCSNHFFAFDCLETADFDCIWDEEYNDIVTYADDYHCQTSYGAICVDPRRYNMTWSCADLQDYWGEEPDYNSPCEYSEGVLCDSDSSVDEEGCNTCISLCTYGEDSFFTDANTCLEHPNCGWLEDANNGCGACYYIGSTDNDTCSNSTMDSDDSCLYCADSVYSMGFNNTCDAGDFTEMWCGMDINSSCSNATSFDACMMDLPGDCVWSLEIWEDSSLDTSAYCLTCDPIERTTCELHAAAYESSIYTGDDDEIMETKMFYCMDSNISEKFEDAPIDSCTGADWDYCSSFQSFGKCANTSLCAWVEDLQVLDYYYYSVAGSEPFMCTELYAECLPIGTYHSCESYQMHNELNESIAVWCEGDQPPTEMEGYITDCEVMCNYGESPEDCLSTMTDTPNCAWHYNECADCGACVYNPDETCSDMNTADGDFICDSSVVTDDMTNEECFEYFGSPMDGEQLTTCEAACMYEYDDCVADKCTNDDDCVCDTLQTQGNDADCYYIEFEAQCGLLGVCEDAIILSLAQCVCLSCMPEGSISVCGLATTEEPTTEEPTTEEPTTEEPTTEEPTTEEPTTEEPTTEEPTTEEPETTTTEEPTTEEPTTEEPTTEEPETTTLATSTTSEEPTVVVTLFFSLTFEGEPDETCLSDWLTNLDSVFTVDGEQPDTVRFYPSVWCFGVTSSTRRRLTAEASEWEDMFTTCDRELVSIDSASDATDEQSDCEDNAFYVEAYLGFDSTDKYDTFKSSITNAEENANEAEFLPYEVTTADISYDCGTDENGDEVNCGDIGVNSAPMVGYSVGALVLTMLLAYYSLV